MGNVYEIIYSLCQERNISGAEMCRGADVGQNTMSELKSGRHKGLSAEKAYKIAKYFGVTVGYLIGEEDRENYYYQLGEYDRELIDLIIPLEKTDKELLYKILEMSDEKKNAMLNMIKAM